MPGSSSFSKSNAFGTTSLKKWIGKRIPAGTKFTATVTKPGNYIGGVKILTVRKKKRLRSSPSAASSRAPRSAVSCP